MQFLNSSSLVAPKPLRKALQIALLSVSSVALLAGCNTTKGLFGNISDGSLDYQEAEQLPPIELPANKETAPFIPLYPTPDQGVNTLELENDSGKRYQLPKPYRQVPTQQESN